MCRDGLREGSLARRIYRADAVVVTLSPFHIDLFWKRTPHAFKKTPQPKHTTQISKNAQKAVLLFQCHPQLKSFHFWKKSPQPLHADYAANTKRNFQKSSKSRTYFQCHPKLTSFHKQKITPLFQKSLFRCWVL